MQTSLPKVLYKIDPIIAHSMNISLNAARRLREQGAVRIEFCHYKLKLSKQDTEIETSWPPEMSLTVLFTVGKTGIFGVKL